MNNLPTKIPIFPLSNFIMFPKTTVPLNIFEPRYIDMVNDVMKSNKFIGMVQPKIKKDRKRMKYSNNTMDYIHNNNNYYITYYYFHSYSSTWK